MGGPCLCPFQYGFSCVQPCQSWKNVVIADHWRTVCCRTTGAAKCFKISFQLRQELHTWTAVNCLLAMAQCILCGPAIIDRITAIAISKCVHSCCYTHRAAVAQSNINIYNAHKIVPDVGTEAWRPLLTWQSKNRFAFLIRRETHDACHVVIHCLRQADIESFQMMKRGRGERWVPCLIPA
jgi:hypothetical protein